MYCMNIHLQVKYVYLYIYIYTYYKIIYDFVTPNLAVLEMSFLFLTKTKRCLDISTDLQVFSPSPRRVGFSGAETLDRFLVTFWVSYKNGGENISYYIILY